MCSDKVENWDSALSRLARTLRFASESRCATSVCGRVRSRFLCKSLVVYARSAGVAALSTPEKILGGLVLGIEKLHETAGDFGLIGRGELTRPAMHLFHVHVLVVRMSGISSHANQLLDNVPAHRRPSQEFVEIHLSRRDGDTHACS